jgi:hypothetical protein
MRNRKRKRILYCFLDQAAVMHQYCRYGRISLYQILIDVFMISLCFSGLPLLQILSFTLRDKVIAHFVLIVFFDAVDFFLKWNANDLIIKFGSLIFIIFTCWIRPWIYIQFISLDTWGILMFRQCAVALIGIKN